MGDLGLATRRRLQFAGESAGPAVEEVEAGEHDVRLWPLRLLLDGANPAVGAEADHAITLRIAHLVAEHRRTARLLGRALQRLAEHVAEEDVVAEDHHARLAGQERLAEHESVRQTRRLRLSGVAKLEPDLRAIAEQPLERRLVLGRRDDQDLAHPGQHEHRERVIDHRLVVDRQKLLGDRERQRMQPRARPAGEDDAAPPHRAPPAARPRRSGEKPRPWSGVHHPGLSTYQRTVRARPPSSGVRADQPSSRRSFEGSIA